VTEPSAEGPGAGLATLVRAIATDLRTRRDELNRLDAAAGDGDLGLTASTAANALLELAPALVPLAEGEAIRKCGMEIARKAPSTGGTLIAFALLAAAKAGVDPDAAPLERAAGYLEAAATTIAERGGVATGDRTMLDALRPGVNALLGAAASGSTASEGARSAAVAAEAGAAATATMDAKVGRAGWLADRAAGHEDAGARLMALVFAAAARAVSGA
jgi:dihydroxyacetone kinase-like protein